MTEDECILLFICLLGFHFHQPLTSSFRRHLFAPRQILSTPSPFGLASPSQPRRSNSPQIRFKHMSFQGLFTANFKISILVSALQGV